MDDLVALLAVGLFDIGLEKLNGLFKGDHIGKLEETGLHDHVDPVAKSHLACDLHCIHVEELQLPVMDCSLDIAGNIGLHIRHGPGRIQEERSPLLETLKNVINLDIVGFMAGYEIRPVNQVGGLDGQIAKPQMRNGDTARFLGVVGEISLGILFGVIADDLDGTLVGTNGSVGSKAPEFRTNGSLGCGVESGNHLQGGVGDIVLDTHGKMVLGSGTLHVVKYRLDHGGIKLLGAQSVTAADNPGSLALFHEGSTHIHIKGIADASGFLGPIKNRNRLCSGWNGRHHGLDIKGSVETHLDQTDPLAVLVETGDRLLNGFTA